MTESIISPPKLAILFDLHDTELLSNLNELHSAQRLGQDVCQLSISTDVINIQFPFIDTLSDVMEPCVDMLAPIMKDRVLAESNS